MNEFAMPTCRRFRCEWLVVAASWIAANVASAAAPLSFSRDIRPILSNHCFQCHGPDAEVRKAGLRLDQRDAAFAPAESESVAIVPGKTDESELVRRVFSDDPAERMPPDERTGRSARPRGNCSAAGWRRGPTGRSTGRSSRPRGQTCRR